jgi:hypothetical protein
MPLSDGEQAAEGGTGLSISPLSLSERKGVIMPHREKILKYPDLKNSKLHHDLKDRPGEVDDDDHSEDLPRETGEPVEETTAEKD